MLVHMFSYRQGANCRACDSGFRIVSICGALERASLVRLARSHCIDLRHDLSDACGRDDVARSRRSSISSSAGWQSLARLVGGDENANAIVGKHLGLDTKGAIVRTNDDHLIVTLGLEDVIVVHTPNATLVADKHSEEQIRQVVKKLEELGWSEYL